MPYVCHATFDRRKHREKNSNHGCQPEATSIYQSQFTDCSQEVLVMNFNRALHASFGNGSVITSNWQDTNISSNVNISVEPWKKLRVSRGHQILNYHLGTILVL